MKKQSTPRYSSPGPRQPEWMETASIIYIASLLIAASAWIISILLSK